jgi:hypothetical protein
VPEHTLSRQRRQRGHEHVEVGPARGLAAREIVEEARHERCPLGERVLAPALAPREAREDLERLARPQRGRAPVEGPSRPARVEVACVGEALGRVDERLAHLVAARALAHEQPPHRLARARELALPPPLEHRVEQGARGVFGHELERGIDPRLERALAQELGCERVDGRDAGLFQL